MEEGVGGGVGVEVEEGLGGGRGVEEEEEVGGREEQDLQVIYQENGKITTRAVSGCRFVPLLGREAWRKDE